MNTNATFLLLKVHVPKGYWTNAQDTFLKDDVKDDYWWNEFEITALIFVVLLIARTMIYTMLMTMNLEEYNFKIENKTGKW